MANHAMIILGMTLLAIPSCVTDTKGGLPAIETNNSKSYIPNDKGARSALMLKLPCSVATYRKAIGKGDLVMIHHWMTALFPKRVSFENILERSMSDKEGYVTILSAAINKDNVVAINIAECRRSRDSRLMPSGNWTSIGH
jgi:hypothetical protein